MRLLPLVVLLAVATPAAADTPLGPRATFSGPVDFFATGAALARDSNADGQVDALAQPAAVVVAASDLAPGATLERALLYWSGTTPNWDDCGTAGPAASLIDALVTFTPPGGAPTPVNASTCYCSGGGATSYDLQACKADVTTLVREQATALHGAYTVDGFAARATNGATDNASFALVLVFTAPGLPVRRVTLYDGLQTMESSVQTISLGGVQVDAPPAGDLTWYALEGDLGGSGTERVRVRGVPGGTYRELSDPLNPVTNPMNRTINTTGQAGVIGVDIDAFDISTALAAGDIAVEAEYSAGTDKWWLVFNLIGVDVFQAAFGAESSKTWALHADVDGNGVPSPGDTVRYRIRLANTGTAAGLVDVTDAIPPEVASWSLVSAGGGVHVPSPTVLIVNDVPVPIGGAAEVVFDALLGAVPDRSVMTNTATYDATPTGDAGVLVAPEVLIRRDRDADAWFDGDDNCVVVPNFTQVDDDGDGAGDACDACPADATDDADGDGVCQDADNCPLVPNATQVDADDDGAGNACDACPADATDDADGDGSCEDVDRCPGVPDPAQLDGDGDGRGDVCDACPADPRDDEDDDGRCAGVDNCPFTANPGQEDADGDGLGDACDGCADVDADGVCDADDNCAALANPAQDDADDDGAGDGCDRCPRDATDDGDGDGVCEDVDVCAGLADPAQEDGDGDRLGDACDPCPRDATDDGDGDGVCEDVDVCPGVADAAQFDSDEDGAGDACDPCPFDLTDDLDGDGVCEDVDACPGVPDPAQVDGDADGRGDACDACPADPLDDLDGDGACADADVCPLVPDPGQEDGDGDGVGDACDGCDDVDGDGVCVPGDNCPTVPNADQFDDDGDGVGDACPGDGCVDCPDPTCPEGEDPDGDDVCAVSDNCGAVSNPDQVDGDGDGLGDACDPCLAGAGEEACLEDEPGTPVGGCCRVGGRDDGIGGFALVLAVAAWLRGAWWRRRRGARRQPTV